MPDDQVVNSMMLFQIMMEQIASLVVRIGGDQKVFFKKRPHPDTDFVDDRANQPGQKRPSQSG